MEDWAEKQLEDGHYHDLIKDCKVIEQRQDRGDAAYCKTHNKKLCRCGWEWQWHYGEYLIKLKK